MTAENEKCDDCGAHLSCGCTMATDRTTEHEAALDALEGMVRQCPGARNGLAKFGVYDFHDCEDHEAGAIGELASANRMVWCNPDGDVLSDQTRAASYARFVDPPKPLLSEEQVAEAMALADTCFDREGEFYDADGVDLRDYLTSLTQPAPKPEVG